MYYYIIATPCLFFQQETKTITIKKFALKARRRQGLFLEIPKKIKIKGGLAKILLFRGGLENFWVSGGGGEAKEGGGFFEGG